MLSLSNQLEKVDLNLKKQDDHLVLKFKEDAYPIISTKVVDIADRATASTNLDDDYFQRGQVVLQGEFVPADSMPPTISIIYNYAYADDQKKFVADVDDKGRFKIIYPLENPQTVMLQIGNSFFSYLATPSGNQAIIIGESTFSGSWTEEHGIDFMGSLAVENEELRLVRPEYMKVRKYFKNDSLQRALESDEYLEYRLGLMESHRQFYLEYFDSLPVSEVIKDMSFRNTRIDAADDLMRYSWLHNLRNKEGVKGAADISDEYVAKVRSLVRDEKEELLAESYAGLNREFVISSLKMEREKTQMFQAEKMYDFLLENVS